MAETLQQNLCEALYRVSNGKFQGVNAQYVAGLITSQVQDEALDINEQARLVFDKIGSLLSDARVIKSEADGLLFCRNIIAQIRGIDSQTLEKQNTNQQERLLEAIILNKLIRVRFDRQAPAKESDVDGAQGASTDSTTNGIEDHGKSTSGYNDPFLGLERVQANFNQFVSIDESMKLVKAAAKRREKQLRMMEQWEESRQPCPPPKRRHGERKFRKLTDLSVPKFSVSVVGRELLKDTALKIVLGHRYGLIGRNGIGKTTFISALARGDIPGVDVDINIGCVEQETAQYENMTPLDCVLAVDEERCSLMAEEAKLIGEQNKNKLDTKGCERLNDIYGRLDEIEASRAESEACSILDGLGLTKEMYSEKKVKDLSGGWRMRVLLARVLFADPDLLCLDEPTNHLDLHAVAWLTNYLRQSQKTCIIVSHARQFLNDVCTDIMEFRDRQLRYYFGDYDAYEISRADRELHQQREIDSQTAKRAHIQKFVDRFRCHASKAALVQSRLKLIAKLPMLESITEDPTLHFKFGVPSELPEPVLVMQSVCFSYKPVDNPEDGLLRNIDFTADLSTRAAICGVNGSGKSTFLKLLIGQLESSSGFTFR